MLNVGCCFRPMRLTRPDRQTIFLTQLDPICVDLLERIVPSADPGDDTAAQARLFSTPTGGREPEWDRDWREFVEPDLRRLFQGALDLVQENLKELRPDTDPEHRLLRIPVKNLEAWIHALNQARLALAARHGFEEGDLEGRLEHGDQARALAAFQVHFYGLLQEWFLHELDRPEP
jgi:hypothetical protein